MVPETRSIVMEEPYFGADEILPAFDTSGGRCHALHWTLGTEVGVRALFGVLVSASSVGVYVLDGAIELFAPLIFRWFELGMTWNCSRSPAQV